MTSKTYEIKEWKCDACGRMDKSKEEKKNSSYLSYSISTAWSIREPKPTIYLDLCPDCDESFQNWKEARRISHCYKCDCNEKD